MANAVTLEFYKSGDSVMVEYNLRAMPLADFCATAGARKVLVKICRALRKETPAPRECENPACVITEEGPAELPEHCDYIRIVGEYVRDHLLDHDSMLDITVSGDTDHVTFRKEK